VKGTCEQRTFKFTIATPLGEMINRHFLTGIFFFLIFSIAAVVISFPDGLQWGEEGPVEFHAKAVQLVVNRLAHAHLCTRTLHLS
jgi:hypothetical protein